jgi:alpha-ketoglutaric semialdehyde dehydrogenase
VFLARVPLAVLLAPAHREPMDRTLLTRHKGDYLAGSFYQAGQDGQVVDVDPATGVRLDDVPYRITAVDEAVADAADAGGAWGGARVEQRCDIIRRVRDVLEARRGALAAMLSREMGKTLWEANLECVASVRAIDLLLEQAPPILREQAHPTARGSLRRRPLGVVGVITPAPYPVYGPIQQLIPALLAGNPVVWNPASSVPLTAQKLAEVFDGGRIPERILSMVQGPRDPIGEALAAHEDVAMVVATGARSSMEAIRAVRRHRATWTQNGGKGWAIVCADADLDRAAYEVVTGAFLSSGQRCNATSRVIVERSVARDFLRRVVALTNGLTVGPPSDPDSFCGPLAEPRLMAAFGKALTQWEDAGISFPVEGGHGRVATNLRRKGQCYVAPAIALVDEPLPDGVIAPEDVQGPLLLAQLVDDAEEAAIAYNQHPYGLSAAVFTESELRFSGLAQILVAGAVNWNRGTIVASARYPNAALRGSGWGAEANGELMRACTWPQSSLGATGRFNPAHRVPGMNWPEAMGVIDPSSVNTPPYRPDDETTDILPPELLPTKG